MVIKGFKGMPLVGAWLSFMLLPVLGFADTYPRTIGKTPTSVQEFKRCVYGYDDGDAGFYLTPGKACYVFGTYLERAADFTESAKYLRKSCEYGHYTGCMTYLYGLTINAPSFTNDARVIVGSWCDKGGIYSAAGVDETGDLCNQLAAHYETKEPKDRKEAYKYYQKSCKTYYKSSACEILLSNDYKEANVDIDAVYRQEENKKQADRQLREDWNKDVAAEDERRRQEKLSTPRTSDIIVQSLQQTQSQIQQQNQNIYQQQSLLMQQQQMRDQKKVLNELQKQNAANTKSANNSNTVTTKSKIGHSGNCASCESESQYKSLTASCKGGSQSACYLAAAFLCQCNLNAGGCGSSKIALQQCVLENNAKANQLGDSTKIAAKSKTAYFYFSVSGVSCDNFKVNISAVTEPESYTYDPNQTYLFAPEEMRQRAQNAMARYINSISPGCVSAAYMNISENVGYKSYNDTYSMINNSFNGRCASSDEYSACRAAIVDPKTGLVKYQRMAEMAAKKKRTGATSATR